MVVCLFLGLFALVMLAVFVVAFALTGHYVMAGWITAAAVITVFTAFFWPAKWEDSQRKE